MDSKKVDWRNLLDFIKYSIPEDKELEELLEEESAPEDSADKETRYLNPLHEENQNISIEIDLTEQEPDEVAMIQEGAQRGEIPEDLPEDNDNVHESASPEVQSDIPVEADEVQTDIPVEADDIQTRLPVEAEGVQTEHLGEAVEVQTNLPGEAEGVETDHPGEANVVQTDLPEEAKEGNVKTDTPAENGNLKAHVDCLSEGEIQDESEDGTNEEEFEEGEIRDDLPGVEIKIAVPEERKVLEEKEVPASPQPAFACTYLGCEEHFSSKNKFIDHYGSSHPHSSLMFMLLQSLFPGKFKEDSEEHRIKLPHGTLMIRLCDDCPASFSSDSLQAAHSRDHQDERLAQCPHCLLFFEKSSVKSHEAQCSHYEEQSRIQAMVGGLEVLACRHQRSGCTLTFTERTQMHRHARVCAKRPSENFHCAVEGCLKKYYYKEDYSAHLMSSHKTRPVITN